MSNSIKWISLGLVAYLCILITKLPAAQVFSRIDMGQKVALINVAGTVWEGQAQTLMVNGLPVDDVKWELDVIPLMWGEVSAYVDAGNARDSEAISFSGDLTYSLLDHDLSATEFNAFLPSDLVIAKLPLPVPVNAGGRFRVQIDEADFAGPECRVFDGNGQWLKATFVSPKETITLGDFTADFGCVDGAPTLTINEPNSFGLSAVARIPANLQISVQGRFKPDDSLPPQVHSAAKFFGQPDSEGYIAIRL